MKKNILKLNECVYLIKDKYTFKEELILDNNMLVYCFVVVDDGVVYGLLEGFEKQTNEEKEKAIKSYLKNKRRLINFEYAKAKPLVELISYKIGK